MDLYIMLACLFFVVVFGFFTFLGPVAGYITLPRRKNNRKNA